MDNAGAKDRSAKWRQANDRYNKIVAKDEEYVDMFIDNTKNKKS